MALREKTRCLIVDDEPKSIAVIAKWIKAMGHACDQVGCSESARKRLKSRTYDYAVVDVKLKVDGKDNDPDSATGRALLQWILRECQRLPVLMMTANETNPEFSAELIEIGARGFILKGSGSHKFQQKIEGILNNSSRARPMSTDKADSPSGRKYELVVNENEPNVMILQGQEVELTKTEFNFMRFMAKYPRKRLSTDRIIGTAWGENSNGGPEDQRIPSVKDGIHKKIKKVLRRYNTEKFIRVIRGARCWMLDIPPAQVAFTAKAAA